MAGRPKRRQALEKIETRGGADYLQDFLMSGGTISSLAKELDLNRGYLHRLLINHDVYSKAIEAIREKAADAHAEMGFQIFENLSKERQMERDLAEEGSRTKELNQVDVAIAREKGWPASICCPGLEPGKVRHQGRPNGGHDLPGRHAFGRFAKNENCSGRHKGYRK